MRLEQVGMSLFFSALCVCLRVPVWFAVFVLAVCIALICHRIANI